MKHILAFILSIAALCGMAQSAGDYKTFRKSSGAGDVITYTTTVNDALWSTGSGGSFALIPKTTFTTPAQVAAGYQPLDATLTALAALATTSYGLDLLIQPNAAAVRTYIGAGTGSGDVVGPVASTANHVPQWDDTSGDVLNDGLAVSTVGGSGNEFALVQYNSTGGIASGDASGGIGVQGLGDPAIQGNSTTGVALYGTVSGAGGSPLRLTNSGGSGKFIQCWPTGPDNVFEVLYSGGLAWPTGTGAQETATNLPAFGAATKGVVPASGGGTSNFLRADGTWAAPGGGGLSDGDKGDITVSSSGTVWDIDAGVVGTAELGGDITAAGEALLDDANAAAQRTTLGLAIGTDVQAYDADLATWSGITPASGVGTFLATPSSANLAAAVTDETGTGNLAFDLTTVLGSQQTTTSTTLVDCTGASVAVAANATYAVEGFILFQSSAAATGIWLALNGPSSPTEFACLFQIPTSSTAVQNRSHSTYDGSIATADTPSQNVTWYANLSGVLVNGGNSGSIQLRFASETGNTVRIQAGTTLRLRKVN